MKLQRAWIPTVGWLLVAGMLAYGAGQNATPAGDQRKTNASESKPDTTDDAAEIRKLIPAASAMARQDMDKLARSHTAPRASDVEEKSLSLMLFVLKPKNNEEAKEQFQFLTERTPKPVDIAREIYRVGLRVGKVTLLRGPVTFIHADRITDCTCKVDGDTAKGTVSFEVPKLYKGKVEYVAKRKDDRWQIEEFIMSAYGIHLVPNAKGTWARRVPENAQEAPGKVKPQETRSLMEEAIEIMHVLETRGERA